MGEHLARALAMRFPTPIKLITLINRGPSTSTYHVRMMGHFFVLEHFSDGVFQAWQSDEHGAFGVPLITGNMCGIDDLVPRLRAAIEEAGKPPESPALTRQGVRNLDDRRQHNERRR